MSRSEIRWVSEAIPREVEMMTGSQVFQITSAPIISNNIYCEQPYCTADGSRFAFIRMTESLTSLWVCEPQTKRITLVEPKIDSGIATCKYSGILYYVISVDNRRDLVKLNLETFEKEVIFDMTNVPLRSIQSVSPDQRYCVGTYIPRESIKNGHATPQVIRIDLKKGEWRVIHENIDIINTHLQYEPSKGKDILVQHNRGAILDQYGNIIKLVGDEGATLYIIDNDGLNYRPLPVGKPYTNPVTGHECWIGDTGEVLLTIGASREEALRYGNLLAAKPGAEKARVVAKGCRLIHISASKDGNLFVGDWPGVPNTPIVIGSIKTGRWIILCYSGASLGSAQFNHAHPYITGDNKWIVFNSDRTGVPQIYIASIPDEVIVSITD
ncbi:MAG: oligogalacturonate lyase family protein [Thermoproteota archaeon]